MNTGFFFTGVAVGFIAAQLFMPTPCKAACVEVSASVLDCSSTAPMPKETPRFVVVIAGEHSTALASQNASDQVQRDNAAIVQQQADWQRYLDEQARLTRWLLVNGR